MEAITVMLAMFEGKLKLNLETTELARTAPPYAPNHWYMSGIGPIGCME
jgi:hypothetical protein